MPALTDEEKSDRRYRNMIYRLYNVLLAAGPWEKPAPELRTPFLWDDFRRANPVSYLFVVAIERKFRYEFSERQCSSAVLAVLQKPEGPAIALLDEVGGEGIEDVHEPA